MPLSSTATAWRKYQPLSSLLLIFLFVLRIVLKNAQYSHSLSQSKRRGMGSCLPTKTLVYPHPCLRGHNLLPRHATKRRQYPVPGLRWQRNIRATWASSICGRAANASACWRCGAHIARGSLRDRRCGDSGSLSPGPLAGLIWKARAERQREPSTSRVDCERSGWK